VHKAFGEPLALLCGDGLIVGAYQALARAGGCHPGRLAALLAAISDGVGAPDGIVAGQAWECESRVDLGQYQRAKTGALFVASTCAGAIAAGADPAQWLRLGECLGEAYQVADDIRDVLDGLKIDRAHIVGLSMGGFATLHFGIRSPGRALSLVIAGAGYGAEKHLEKQFREACEVGARQFETIGCDQFSHIYCSAAGRIPFLLKDPRGWEEFRRMFAEHSSKGSALTMRGVQGKRPSIYDLEAEIKTITAPTLIITGDEDDHCLQPNFFLKRMISTSGLAVMPKTGHTMNLEEPAAFNGMIAEFLAQVENGKWLARDPRADPAEIVKTK